MVQLSFPAYLACGEYQSIITSRFEKLEEADRKPSSTRPERTDSGRLPSRLAAASRRILMPSSNSHTTYKSSSTDVTRWTPPLYAVLFVQPLSSFASGSSSPPPLDKRQATTQALTQLQAGPVTYVTTACRTTCASMLTQANVRNVGLSSSSSAVFSFVRSRPGDPLQC
jgi:hypothetical protein